MIYTIQTPNGEIFADCLFPSQLPARFQIWAETRLGASYAESMAFLLWDADEETVRRNGFNPSDFPNIYGRIIQLLEEEMITFPLDLTD